MIFIKGLKRILLPVNDHNTVTKGTKGSLRNKFTELALGFRLGSVDFKEQKVQ